MSLYLNDAISRNFKGLAKQSIVLWLKLKLTIWTCFGVIAERKGDLLETAVFAGSTSITNFADESFGKAQGAVVDVVGELGQNPIKKFDQCS